MDCSLPSGNVNFFFAFLTIEIQHWLGGKKDGQPELLQVSEMLLVFLEIFIFEWFLTLFPLLLLNPWI